MNDVELRNLEANARRFGEGEDGPRKEQAAMLLPLIEDELAARAARAPAPKPPAKRTGRVRR